MKGILRWMKFNLVGFGGVLVQLGFLEAWLHFSLGNYLMGAMVAVEAALLHNFGWHCVYTWKDRPTRGLKSVLNRALRFQLSNGAVSLVGNLLLMPVLLHLLAPTFNIRESWLVLVANGIAILVTSTANFLLGDRFVFANSPELQSPG